MSYEHKDYQLKFIFTRINLECHAHVEICHIVDGRKVSSFAFKKLENGFIYMLSKKLTDIK